jgi:glycosyltransferase involved in cell wall biosynthesis
VHVLHVIEATIGGTRRHVVDATRGLAQRGVEVTLVASALRQPDFRDDLRELGARGVRVIELPMVRSIAPGQDLAHLRALERTLRELRPDVVHTHSSKAGVLGRLASMSSGIGARVHTPHTFAFLFGAMFGPLQRNVFREIERALAGATDRVIAVSADEAATFAASGVVPRERIVVVPNGVDPAPWAAAAPFDWKTLGIAPQTRVIVVVGLLNVAKGQDLALRALAQDGLEGAHLVLAGHGEMREPWEALASELGLADRVHFLGWRDDVPRLVAGADVVLLPSRWEGMPYVALQAMAAARPVVATRVDGARALIEDGRTGFLCDLESPQSIAQIVRRVLALGEGERRSLGLAGRARVAAEFGLDAMIARLLAVYAEVA